MNKCDLRKKPKSAKKLFFSGVLVLTLANFLVKAVGLISKIALNRVVGSIGAGYYSSAYEIYAYLYVISTAGLPVALSIMIAKSRSKGRLLETKKIFDIAIILFLIIGFSFSIIMIAFSKQLALLIGAPETSLCIVAIAPTMLFICLSSCMRGYFQGYQRMLPTALSQLIESAGKIDSVEVWGKRKLAYEINDKTEGYYVLVNFSSKSDFPAELDRIYKISEDIMRSIIIKKN